jgi:signal transduction histidine kinase
MMVNPAKGEFLVVKFQEDWKYLLYSLSWQLLISLLLIGLLLGTFFYLMKTIFQQNKMAELRKNFVDNMTHELKTPVSTVMAAVEAIQLYGVQDDKEKMKRYLDISKKELEHLSTMIEKVLQMDIDASRGIVLQRVDFNLVATIQSAIEVAQLNKTKVVTIELIAESMEIIVNGDESHLRNVINNLLENAIKYAGQQVTIKVELKTLKENVQIRITDNGKGIAPEYQQQIFDMFFRVPSGNLHDVKGFGLGLAYVKQVVKRHDGKITVESELGRGSTFAVRLPY